MRLLNINSNCRIYGVVVEQSRLALERGQSVDLLNLHYCKERLFL
jgi:hypothetical protein